MNALILCLAMGLQAGGQRYSMTIYVEEGIPNGHIFMSLNDAQSRQTTTRGFYSKNKKLALFGAGGGEIRDDGKTDWNVRKSYPISEAGYNAGIKQIDNVGKANRAWWVNNHCGDFVEGIAKVAGVKVDLPWHLTGRNRPGIFAAYLRKQGGEENPAHTSGTGEAPGIPGNLQAYVTVSGDLEAYVNGQKVQSVGQAFPLYGKGFLRLRIEGMGDRRKQIRKFAPPALAKVLANDDYHLQYSVTSGSFNGTTDWSVEGETYKWSATRGASDATVKRGSSGKNEKLTEDEASLVFGKPLTWTVYVSGEVKWKVYSALPGGRRESRSTDSARGTVEVSVR